MASTDALPVPRKNVAYRLAFAIYKNDGTLITGAAGLDSEVSKDMGTAADCTNEATEIATATGMYYLDLTSTEMNADSVAVVVKTSSTGAVIPTFFLYPQETGDIKVDVQSLLGTAWLTPGTAGTPDVNVKLWNGLATVALPLVPTTAGRTLDVSATGEAGLDWANIGSPTTAVNLSATNIDVDQVVASVSGAVASVTAVSSGAITEASYATTAGSFAPLGIVDQGTAQSASSTGVVLRSAAAFADDTLIGCTIQVLGSTQGYWQSQLITDNALSGDTVTVNGWTVTPSGTITYKIIGTAPSSGGAGLDAAGVRAAVGLASANLDTQLGAIDDYVDTEVAAIKAKTDQLVFTTSNQLDVQVISMASNSLTSTALATSAATEIQSGLSTLDAAGVRAAIGLASANLDTQLSTIDDFLDTEVAAIKAKTDNLPSDPADASDISGAFSTVNSTLGTIAGYLDTEIAAIKAKTDQLTFTVTNQVDSNAITVDEDEILDDQLTDSVPADGTLPTVRQALYMLVQFMTERSVSGTTLTVRKTDGSTSLMTFTLNDATSPTSITRSG